MICIVTRPGEFRIIERARSLLTFTRANRSIDYRSIIAIIHPRVQQRKNVTASRLRCVVLFPFSTRFEIGYKKKKKKMRGDIDGTRDGWRQSSVGERSRAIRDL